MVKGGEHRANPRNTGGEGDSRNAHHTIRFRVNRVIWRNSDDTFVIVVGYEIPDGGGHSRRITAKVNCADSSWLSCAEPVQLFGTWETHPKYGAQFRGTIADEDVAIVEELLGAAKKCGFEHKALGLIATLSSADARKVLDNPYTLLGSGIVSWGDVDKLGDYLGIDKDSWVRVESFMWLSLDSMGDIQEFRDYAKSSASTWIPLSSAISTASSSLGLPPAKVVEILDKCDTDRISVLALGGGNPNQDPIVMLRRVRLAEDLVAAGVGHLQNFFETGEPQEPLSISDGLSSGQVAAVRLAAENGVSLVTGPPGTGKTTCIAEMCRLLHNSSKHVSVAAFTGKAADRVKKVLRLKLGADAAKMISCSTIHRLLECVPNKESPSGFLFLRNAENSLSESTIIVDESSMIPVELMESLVSALPLGCRLVLVGDHNQLPPISPGIPFRDLMDSGSVPVTDLTEIFRQKEGSAIAEACRVMQTGNAAEFFSYIRGQEAGGEISWIPCGDENIPTEVLKILLEAEDGQISMPGLITPVKGGVGGTLALNRAAKEALNPNIGDAGIKLSDGSMAHAGDPVMWIKNDYNRLVFNGDSFVVKDITRGPKKTPKSIILESSDGEARVLDVPAADCTKFLMMSYCITVHKSQGSEWENVIVCVPQHARFMCYRSLLYTAISRAKRKLWIIGSAESVRVAVESKATRPQTRLLRLLKGNHRGPQEPQLSQS